MAIKVVAIETLQKQGDRQKVFYGGFDDTPFRFLERLICGFRVFSLRDEIFDSAFACAAVLRFSYTLPAHEVALRLVLRMKSHAIIFCTTFRVYTHYPDQ